MPKDPFIYVNGMDETLDQALMKMRGYNRRYLRDMGTVIDAERGLLSRESLDKYAPKQLKEMVMQRIRRNNLTDPTHGGRLPILCKDGKLRYYRPDAWSETIAWTRSRALQEEGLHNQMTRAGFDLVQVSIGGSGDPCTNWEGMILSITGETPGYPTVDEAQGSGDIFHPRCVHSTSPFLITEDENGPKIWGRDDLTPKAAQQIKEAGTLRTGTIPSKTIVSLAVKNAPINMQNTNLVRNSTEGIAQKITQIEQKFFSKKMNIDGVNDALYAITDASNRFPAGKLSYFGDKDQVTKIFGSKYRFNMGKYTTGMFVRINGKNMIVFRAGALESSTIRTSYKKMGSVLTSRYGGYNFTALKAQGVAPEVINILKKQKVRHWSLNSEIGGTKSVIYHEYGHHIYHNHPDKNTLRGIVNKSFKSGWARPLGKYPQSSMSEFFSEVFSAYMQGLTHLIDPDILEWLENNDLGG